MAALTEIVFAPLSELVLELFLHILAVVLEVNRFFRTRVFALSTRTIRVNATGAHLALVNTPTPRAIPVPSIPPSAIPFFQRNGFIPEKNLGEGVGGVVVQALSLREGKKVAIKMIDTFVGSPSKEVISLQKVQRHPNIIDLYGVQTTEFFVFIIMELADAGTLTDYIQKNNQLPERRCQSLFRDLISGIKHCHNNRVVHDDLHSRNLLLDKNGTLKLSDFGLARILGDDQQTTDDGRAVDIWSAGTVLFHMVYGYEPYSLAYGYVPYSLQVNRSRLESELSKGHRLRPGVSDGCKDLLKNILRQDLLSPAEILEHPWMKD